MKLIKDFISFISYNVALHNRKDGKFILAQQKRMANKLKTILDNQQSYITKELKGFSGLNSIKQNSINDDIEKLLDGLPGQSALVEIIVFYSQNTMSKGGARSIKDLALRKFGISFDVKHPEAVKYFRDFKTLQLSDKNGTITATTKDRIKEIIANGIESGASYNDLAKQIVDQGDAGVFSRARAEMIAVNQAGDAYEQGRKFPINDFVDENPSRSVEKSWLTVGDDRVEPDHVANEDQGWIAYDENFSGTGDSEPPASDNPRCRCTIEYRIN